MHKDLMAELKEMNLDGDGLLFDLIDPHSNYWKNAMATLKMNYSLKQLRKTLATEIAATLGISAASFLLDHEAERTTTDHYIGEMKKEPAFLQTIVSKLRDDINKKVKFVK